ncbi:MAG: ferritin family protein [Methanospirillum sp.]
MALVRREVRKLFGELAGEEKGHREYPQKLLSRNIAPLELSSTDDYKVGGSIPPDSRHEARRWVRGRGQKALAAMQMYTQLANASGDAEVTKLFTELAEMERGHRARLKDIYVSTAFTEAR